MATTYPYALNTGNTIAGTEQTGNIARGTTVQDYSANPGNVKWWMGPNEDVGYVIVCPFPNLAYGQDAPGTINAGIRFWRSANLSDGSFLSIANTVARRFGAAPFTTVQDAESWLVLSGFPTNYNAPTPSITPSRTPSISFTPTISFTPSVSFSRTPTQTPSTSFSQTPTITPSTSFSQTPSKTPGASSSMTPTQTPSTSFSQTPTISISTSFSQTPTRTPSTSFSQTPSLTPTITPSIAVSGEFPLNNLVGYWKLDETYGAVAYDETNNSYNGDMLNTPTLGATGILGSAITFTKTNTEYIEMGNACGNFGLNDFTISAWINIPSQPSDFCGIMGKWGTAPYWYLSVWSDNTVVFRISFDDAINLDTVSNSTVAATTWYHIVCTADRSGYTNMYVNGAKQTSSIDITAGIATGLTNTNEFNIGNIGAHLSNFYFNGTIDEVGIWDRLLSETEIATLYNSGAGKTYTNPSGFPRSNLVAYYKLDEAVTAGKFYDSTGNMNLTSSSSPLYEQTGKIGFGAAFSNSNAGASNYTQANYSLVNPHGDEYSISCWVYLTTLPSTHGVDSHIFRGSLSGTPWENIVVRVGSASNYPGMRFTGPSDNNYSTANVGLSITTWYHLVFVIRGAGNKPWIWVNNTCYTGDTAQVGDIYDLNGSGSSAGYNIGRTYEGANDEFQGIIDELGCWNRALTPAEVSALYNSGNGLSNTGVSEPVSLLSDGNTFGWWDTTQVGTITKDGSNLVSAWADRIGSGATLSQASGTLQPTYSTDGIEFDGVDNYLSTGSVTLNNPTRVYMVIKFPTYAGADKAFTSGVSDTTAAWLLYDKATIGNIRTYHPSAYSNYLNAPANQHMILTATFSGGSSSIQFNMGVKITGAGTGAMVNPGGFQVGRRTTTYCNVRVKEIIYRKIIDSANDEATIQNYLFDKHIAPIIDYDPIYDGYTNFWYDYTDAGTLALTSVTGVTSWTDKSKVRLGNYVLTAPYSGTYPELRSTGLYFDGVNDVMTGSTANIAQPWTIYLLVKQHSWTNQDYILCGNANSPLLWQFTPSPNIRWWDVGASVYVESSGLTIGSWGVVCMVGNGTSSLLQINNGTPVTASGDMNDGITTTIQLANINNGNIEVKSLIVRLSADDSTARAAIYNFLVDKYGI